MSREFDQASDLEIESRESAIAHIRAKNAPETHPDFDGVTCVDCGTDIPAARLFMGKIRCVDCQTVLERR